MAETEDGGGETDERETGAHLLPFLHDRTKCNGVFVVVCFRGGFGCRRESVGARARGKRWRFGPMHAHQTVL